MLPPGTIPPTAAAGVDDAAMAEEVTVLLAATVLAGHMMMKPLFSPRLARSLASARMVKEGGGGVVSVGARVTMVPPLGVFKLNSEYRFKSTRTDGHGRSDYSLFSKCGKDNRLPRAMHADVGKINYHGMWCMQEVACSKVC